jgi:hypothetical protein
MSVHEQLLDTTKKPEEAVPRENLGDTEFETRVETWRDYLADAVDGPKLEIEQHSTYVKIHGVSIHSGDEFSFSIPFKDDIDTTYGTSRGCELRRIDFYPKPTGEQLRVQYIIINLPEGKQDDSFTTDEKTHNTIVVTYDTQSNTKKNVCLNQDKFGYSNQGSPHMLPLFVRDKN